MQKIISFLFFFPLFLVLGISALNPTVLFTKSDIQILPFFFSLKNIPFLAWIIVFFSLYILMIWILLKFSNLFSNLKKQKLENEVNRLKANIHDGQGVLVEELKKGFQETLDKTFSENKQNIEILKKENEKTISQLNYEIKTLKEKIDIAK